MQSRRTFVKNIAASTMAMTTMPAWTQQNPKKRNIIFLLIDDQRYDFLSCLGHPWIKTPQIDKLAENGMIFENAYVTTSLCSPSRASILTGQYAHTHRVVDNATPIDKSTPTFATELQKHGYKTAFIGKWHMGGGSDEPRPEFDHWVSFKGQGPYNDPMLNINGERIKKQGYTTDILTEEACGFIERQSSGEQPYCLYLSHKSVHEPFTPAARHQGYYQDLNIPRPDSFHDTEENNKGKPEWVRKQRRSWHGAERDYSIGGDYGDFDGYFRRYSECMIGVDDSIGRVTETLTKLGQLDSTIIIYYSDNGYLIGEHGLIDKRVMYEESIRVPCFVHCPEIIMKPVKNKSFILNVDLAPTILDMAGIRKPDSMHGKSFYPIVEGESNNWREDFVYEYFCDPEAPQTPTMFGLRTEKYSYMTYHGVWDLYDLYDMQVDPQQQNNLLGDIQWGHDYGTFLRHIKQQKPDLYPVVKQLDDRLTALLAETDGVRQPVFNH